MMKQNILNKGQLEPWISVIIGIIATLIVIYVLYNPIEIMPKIQPRSIYSFLNCYYKFKIYIGPVLNYVLDKKFYEIFKNKAATFLQSSIYSEFNISECINNLVPTNEEIEDLEEYLNEYSETIMSNTKCGKDFYYSCSGYNVTFFDCSFSNTSNIFSCKLNATLHIKTKKGIKIYKINFYHNLTSNEYIWFSIKRKYNADMLSICNFLKLVHDYIVNNLTNDVCNINEAYYEWCYSNNLTNKTFRLDKDLFIIEGKVDAWNTSEGYRKYTLNISSKRIVYIKLFEGLRLENIIYEEKLR